MAVKHKKMKKTEMKKREEEKRLAAQTGIWMGPVQEPSKHTRHLSLYLVNALLNFMIVFSTIGCILDSFEVEWNTIWLAPVLCIAAVVMCLFYYHPMIRLTGYIFVITGFVLGVQQLMLYLRSGFAVISNRVMEVLELQLSLPIERQYEVYVENERAAVSLCLLFIGIVAMLFFNIIISEFKNYWIVIFFTFPLVQIPIYLNRKLPILYLLLYIAGIFILYCLRNGGHFGVVGRKQKNFYQRKWKKERYDIYRADGESNLALTIALLVLSIVVVSALQVIYPRSSHNSLSGQSQWKAQSETLAKRIALVGFYGMFYQNSEGAGGVGTGKLGNVNMVRMDYEPDLFLYTSKTGAESSMYIRSFSAMEYKDNQWNVEEEEQEYCAHFQTADEFVYLDSLDQHFLNTQEKDIRIQNVGANEQFPYIPYWNGTGVLYHYQTGRKASEERLPVGYYIDRSYLAYMDGYSVTQMRQIVRQVRQQGDSEIWDRFFAGEEEYCKYVYENYLQVDEEQKERLLKFCEENGIRSRDEDVVEQVQQFLHDNYTYTLMPGRTPENEDFVDYFLYKQKKGYCTYFASAATLMYRSMGIPARYVAGYAIESEDFTSSERVSAGQLRDWSGEEQELQKIEVTDAKAHAWVEIYIDGFGWYPVEVTTSDMEEQPLPEENQALSDLIGNVFGPEAVQRVRKTTIKIVARLIGLALAAVAIYMIVSIVIRALRRWTWKSRQTDETLCSLFDYFWKMAKACGCQWKEGASYQEIGNRIQHYFYLPKTEVERLVFFMEQARYSSKSVNQKEWEWCYEKVMEYTKKMYQNLKWYQKWKVRWIKHL